MWPQAAHDAMTEWLEKMAAEREEYQETINSLQQELDQLKQLQEQEQEQGASARWVTRKGVCAGIGCAHVQYGAGRGYICLSPWAGSTAADGHVCPVFVCQVSDHHGLLQHDGSFV